MYQLVLTNQFKKDIKRLQRRAYDMAIIKQAIIDLENNGQLQSALKPHRLSGNYIGYWEAHL